MYVRVCVCLFACLLVCLFVCLIVVVSLYIRNIPTHFFSNENEFDDRQNRDIINRLHAALEEKERSVGNLKKTVGNLKQTVGNLQQTIININSCKDSVFAAIQSKLEKLKEGLDMVTDNNEHSHVRVFIK